jgi:hypothetical protein
MEKKIKQTSSAAVAAAPATTTSATTNGFTAPDVRPLPAIVNKDECVFKLVKRGHRAAMYEQYYDGALIAVEVFIIKVFGGRKMMDKFIEKYERFPGVNSSDYYSCGGTNKRERAEKMYEEIENGNKNI